MAFTGSIYILKRIMRFELASQIGKTKARRYLQEATAGWLVSKYFDGNCLAPPGIKKFMQNKTKIIKVVLCLCLFLGPV